MAISSVRTLSARDHAVGVALSLTVAVIWVGSSEIIHSLAGLNYDKPFFLTYLNTACFVLYFLGFLNPSWRRKTDPHSTRSAHGFVSIEADEIPLHSIGETSSDESISHQPTDQILGRPSVREIAIVGAALAPLYFLANLLFNAGLGMTSVASSTTISSLGSLFALFIGAFIGVEVFSSFKLCASILTVVGVAIIGGADEKKGGAASITGDVVTVLAAVCFALFTTVLKKRLEEFRDRGQKGSVVMIFAFVGLVTALFFWLVLPLLHVLRLETFELPRSKQVYYLLLINALIGSVLSDVLWAKSVELTTPVIGALAIQMNVPLSLLTDHFFGRVNFSAIYLVGTALVFCGFAIVNFDELRRRWAEELASESQRGYQIDGSQTEMNAIRT